MANIKFEIIVIYIYLKNYRDKYPWEIALLTAWLGSNATDSLLAIAEAETVETDGRLKLKLPVAKAKTKLANKIIKKALAKVTVKLCLPVDWFRAWLLGVMPNKDSTS